MPVIVVLLFAATTWVMLKMFVFDRHTKSKAEPVAETRSENFALMDAEASGYENALVQLHSDNPGQHAREHTGDLILDPKTLVGTYSNRLSPSARAALSQTNQPHAAIPSPLRPSQSITKGDIVLDPQNVIKPQPARAGATSQPMQAEETLDAPYTTVASADNPEGVATATSPGTALSDADSRAIFTRAGKLFREGKLRYAEVLCLQLHEDAPQCKGVNNLLGEIYSRQKQLDLAVASFEQALREEPDNAVYHSNLGLVLSRLDKNDAAGQHLTTASQLEPKNAAIQLNLAWHYHKLARYEDELKCLDAAQRLDPKNPQIQIRRVHAMIELGQYDQAEKEIQSEIAANPRDPQPHLLMAFLQTRRGNAASAVEWLQKTESLTSREAILKTLERIHDFDPIKESSPYKDYLASLKSNG